ncbi:MAG: cysteine-rich small domain-containing protein [Lachnospiraceae bacterium]|nr:cysteine-rich small domain-containing protein [Lachnospiraceae bacterium]MDD7327834.1 cysteine-rich small domain-containing protein [Lachnospiraceae bacterium]
MPEEKKYQNSYKYFENRDCRFYPCHDSDHINCLFCYCPLYLKDDCPGTYTWIQAEDGRKIKSCMDCMWPHEPENYEQIMKLLSKP